MTGFTDNTAEQRFEQPFDTPTGAQKLVFADYAVEGATRAILHVEADPELRGSGASGQFMKSLAEHARGQSLKLRPVCGYAAAWLKRNPAYADVVA